MNKLTKAAVLSAAVVLAGQAAHAQDLILGFTSGTATTDYTIDLGAISGFSSTGITQLGGLMSMTTFNSVFTSGTTGVSAGAVGGVSAGATGDYAVTSVLRTGSNPFGQVGTESAPAQLASGINVTAAAGAAESISIGTPLTSSQNSFTTAGNALASASVANELGISSLQAFSGNTIIEDLFSVSRLPKGSRTTPASAWTYAGSLEIDLSGANPVVEFIGADAVVAPVPEPATYGIIAGAGLLALSLRRQFRRSTV